MVVICIPYFLIHYCPRKSTMNQEESWHSPGIHSLESKDKQLIQNNITCQVIISSTEKTKARWGRWVARGCDGNGELTFTRKKEAKEEQPRRYQGRNLQGHLRKYCFGKNKNLCKDLEVKIKNWKEANVDGTRWARERMRRNTDMGVRSWCCWEVRVRNGYHKYIGVYFKMEHDWRILSAEMTRIYLQLKGTCRGDNVYKTLSTVFNEYYCVIKHSTKSFIYKTLNEYS